MNNYKLVFDEVILKQLQKLKENEPIKQILSKMFDKIEEQGVNAGKLIDSSLHLYEIKTKKPAIRLYFKQIDRVQILLFEFEVKKSELKQKQTINKLRVKLVSFFKTLNLF